jgi:hypothetical protein
MTRLLLSIVVAAATVGVLLIPVPEAQQPGQAPALTPPSVAVCPVDEGSGRSTRVGVVSDVEEQGRFTAFAAGVSAGTTSFTTSRAGTASISLAEVAPVGVGAGLVELPGTSVAAGSVIEGPESVGVDACVTSPAQQTLLTGGSTVSGQEFEVQLMNPYAGEALVDLVTLSESGLEAAPQLRGISVPPRSTVVLDLAETLPGRQSMAISVEVASGSVMTTGRYGVGSDVATWHAVPPALDWYLPIPNGGIAGQVLISTAAPAEVGFQVDVYGPQGLIEGFRDGTVPARGAVSVSLSELELEGASAVRVISTQPVAVFMRDVIDAGAALTSGASTTASQWLLPGGGLSRGGRGSVVILNAGLDEDRVTVTARREEPVTQEVVVPAGTVVQIPSVEGRANAYTVEGGGDLVALWVTNTDTGRAYSMGVPVLNE